MKNFVLILVTLLFCTPSLAQDIKLTLNDGNVVSGSTSSLFMFDGNSEIRVKDAKSGEKKDFCSADVKEVKYYNKVGKEWLTFIPLVAQKSLPSVWVKNPKPFKNPVFMLPLYTGKRVSAYKHFISTQTNTKKAQINGSGYVLYFLVKGESTARAYWMTSAIGAKAMLKIVFKDYPEMKSVVSELDTDKFYEDPLMIIRKFDALK